MHTVVNGTLTNYEILSSKKSKIILILHGWGKNFTDWLPIGKKLSQSHKVILLDLPGFGQSQFAEKHDFDTYDYANFVAEFVRKLRLGRISLIGHSFGGKAAIVVVSKHNFVEKLVLVDPSGVEKKSTTTMIKASVYQLLKPIMSLMPKSIKSLIFKKIASEDYKNAGELQGSFKKIIAQNISEEASKINVPSLIVWGDKDIVVPVQNAKVLKNLIKNSIIRIVWGAGHHPHLDKPDKFLQILNEFI